MRLTTDRDTLFRLAAAVARVCDPKSSMPILSNLRLSAEGAALRLDATDLNRTFVARVPADVSEQGATTVNAKQLLALLKTAPKGQVTLEAAEPPPPPAPPETELQKHVKVCAVCAAGQAAGTPPKCEAGEIARKAKPAPAPRLVIPDLVLTASNGARFVLRALLARDYPRIPAAPAALHPVADVASFRQLLARVAPMISTDETRYHLNGAMFHAPGDEFMVVSTDGHRMTKATCSREALGLPPLKDQQLLPRLAILDLLHAIKATSDVALEWIKGHLAAQVDDLTMIFKLNDAQFPPYEQVIPKSFDRSLQADRLQLLAAAEQVKGMAFQRTWGITLGMTNGALRLRTDNPDTGQTQVDVPVVYTGEPFLFGVCAVYLIDLLKALPDRIVTLRFNESLDPAGIVAEGFTSVIMPMRYENDQKAKLNLNRADIQAMLPPAADRQPDLSPPPVPAKGKPVKAASPKGKPAPAAPVPAPLAPAADPDLCALCSELAERPLETRAACLSWLQEEGERRRQAKLAQESAPAGPRLVYSAPRVPGLRQLPQAARRPAKGGKGGKGAGKGKAAAKWQPTKEQVEAAGNWDW